MAGSNIKGAYSTTNILVLNVVVSSICFLLFGYALYVYFDLYFHPNINAYSDGQGGMEGLANLYYLGIHALINTVGFIIGLSLLGMALKRKRTMNLFMVINFFALIISFAFPVITHVIYFYL